MDPSAPESERLRQSKEARERHQRAVESSEALAQIAVTLPHLWLFLTAMPVVHWRDRLPGLRYRDRKGWLKVRDGPAVVRELVTCDWEDVGRSLNERMSSEIRVVRRVLDAFDRTSPSLQLWYWLTSRLDLLEPLPQGEMIQVHNTASRLFSGCESSLNLLDGDSIPNAILKQYARRELQFTHLRSDEFGDALPDLVQQDLRWEEFAAVVQNACAKLPKHLLNLEGRNMIKGNTRPIDHALAFFLLHDETVNASGFPELTVIRIANRWIGVANLVLTQTHAIKFSRVLTVVEAGWKPPRHRVPNLGEWLSRVTCKWTINDLIGPELSSRADYFRGE